jgi:hypothetical protein
MGCGYGAGLEGVNLPQSVEPTLLHTVRCLAGTPAFKYLLGKIDRIS